MTAAPAIPGTLDLGGTWHLRADPKDEGLAQNWWNFYLWWDQHQAIEIPGAFQTVLGADYHGIAWLARIVRIPTEWIDESGKALAADARIRLRFDAVATDAIVQVNGIEVGRHSGDYLPFEFDITDAVERGWARESPVHPPLAADVAICLRVDEVPGSRPPPGETVERGHITKGFHDVLSCQHGGVWGGVSIRCTPRVTALLDGISVRADPVTGRVRVRVELQPVRTAASLACLVVDPTGQDVGVALKSPELGSTVCEFDPILLPGPCTPWSAATPALYTLKLDVVDCEHGRARGWESHSVRFGFRTVSTGGTGGRNDHILLNGKPLLLRGILHWGHEPDHIAPAPTPEQVRAEFARLRELGFNCVCLCMWYPPRWYYDIADETGMLLWQEHPVWKSPMEEELIPEYQRAFEG